MKPTKDRREALTVGSGFRSIYLSIIALVAAEIALLFALAGAIDRMQDLVPAAFPARLAALACVVAFLACMLALGLATFAVVHVHRTQGAARAIIQALRALRENGGDVAPVRLRPRDNLTDLAAEVNALIEARSAAPRPAASETGAPTA